jgi:hypothetical protein
MKHRRKNETFYLDDNIQTLLRSNCRRAFLVRAIAMIGFNIIDRVRGVDASIFFHESDASRWRLTSDDDRMRGNTMSSVTTELVNFMRSAERVGIPGARFFAAGLTKENQLEICGKCSITLIDDLVEFFGVVNGVKAPVNTKLNDLWLVMNYGLLDLSRACENYQAAFRFGGMPSEYFPIFWDFADGLICVVQHDINHRRPGAVVFWDPVDGVTGGFSSLQDFLRFAGISLDECSLKGGGIDHDCTILNANKYAKMVDPEAKVFSIIE